VKRKSWLKLGVGLAAFVPAGVIAFEFLTNRLGANPIAAAMNQLGLWTLILLLCSLACTPLKLLFDWNWPLQLRRLLGLCAFAYVCMHFLVYLVLDQFFAWDEIWKDIAKRKFITVGFAAFVLLIPLAITSTKGMVKRLGFARWKRLHRLVYVAATLGVIHFLWRVKVVGQEQIVYATILVLLLAVRVVFALRGRRPRSG
jgi:sulfoxide reductase heme-binding subunit YedZ